MTHVAAAQPHLDKVQVNPFHEKFDPHNLPFSVAKPTNVKPRLTKQDYKSRPVAPPKRAQVAANGPLTGILTAADVTGALPTSPADPSYVAPTDDVQITPAIQAQAGGHGRSGDLLERVFRIIAVLLRRFSAPGHKQ